ncbi:unnamed protein product, partial [Linum tenue]
LICLPRQFNQICLSPERPRHLPRQTRSNRRNNTVKFTDFGRRLLLLQDTHRRLPLPHGGTFLREPQVVAAGKKKENLVAATCQGRSPDDAKKKLSLQLLLSRRHPPVLSPTSEKGGLLKYK